LSLFHNPNYDLPEPAWCMDQVIGVERPVGIRRGVDFQLRTPTLPFKLNQDRRHHIPRQQHKVTNWPACEAGLSARQPDRVVH
jgi:hypothetical protein